MNRYDYALKFADDVTEGNINAVLERLHNNEYDSLIETILHEMSSDCDAENGENLLLLYESVDDVGKAIIDSTLVIICGWSLGSIINIFLKQY